MRRPLALKTYRSDLVLKRAGKHVGKQLQEDGEGKLKKWDDGDDNERNETEEVGRGPQQLAPFATDESLSAQQLKEEPRGNFRLVCKKLATVPIMQRAILYALHERILDQTFC